MKSMLKTILLIAIPSIMENLFQVLIGFGDTFFISRIGTDAIVGVGATNLLINIYISFYLAIGVGATAMVSRFFGANDESSAKLALSQSLGLATLLSIILAIISLVLRRPLLGLLGLEKDIIKSTMPYFITITISTIPLALTTVLSSGLRSIGDTQSPMKVGLLVNIINFVLNYVLIFGIFSFKGIGILGAGLASLIARVIGMAILYFKVSNVFSISIKDIIILKHSFMNKLFMISLPAALEKLIMRSGQVVYGALIIGIGKKVYAAHNIAGTIESFSYLPAMGFGVAAATLIGQSLGKDDIDSAKKYGWYSYGLAVSFMMVIAIGFSVFAPLFSGWFTKDPEIIKFSTIALRIIVFVQPFLASTMVITSALQGAGDTKYPMFSTLFGIWTIRVLGIYILGVKLNLGIAGVWLAVALDIVIRGILLLIRYNNGKWANINLSIKANE